MTEENSNPAIKALFSQLLKLIVESCKSGPEVYSAITAVGSWCAIVLASLVLMLEQKDKERTDVVIDRIIDALRRDTKKHAVLIRGMKKG